MPIGVSDKPRTTERGLREDGERSALASGAKSELVCLLESADTRSAKDDALVSLSSVCLAESRYVRADPPIRHVGFSYRRIGFGKARDPSAREIFRRL